ncbi:DUF3054 domain-containing protein [Marinithermus hydrothermalis]|uniref:DUF3054 domain-containing protein n=1 Tax=Marinithermus hydrothermalis (strain DSM 14884 / JCM 11576 / T1) TaxID=869210 RepID=F2NL40_MARHT|nr:DUF3054 domain-containing protein [Marinithermus hydrothermalis]AEB11443.1 hypothetical protein Marky_0693 [Marinithermus hydrothermalis DSM 14884]
MGRTLAWGDALMIGAFAVLGLMAHGEAVSLAGILRNAAPIWLTWFLLAPFLRTYTRPGWRNLLLNWALAVPAGVWLRFMVLGRSFDLGFFIFLAVTLAVTLALLVAWRALAFRRLVRA